MKSNRDLNSLQPHVAIRAKKLIDYISENFEPIAVHETHRTAEYQKYLYGQGRTRDLDKPVITWVDGFRKKSNHQSGIAFDIHFKNNPNFPSGKDKRWIPVRDYAKKLGLISGFDLWDGVDANHFQCSYNLSKWEEEFLNWGVENGYTNAEDAMSSINLPRMMGILKKFSDKNNL